MGIDMKIIKQQKNSKNCIICGMDNPLGLKAFFYDMEDGCVASVIKFRFEHQSYKGRVHGGMISALLDELIGRAVWVTEPDTYAVTTTLSVKFRKPVPYDTHLKARAYITFNSARGFSAVGELFDFDDNLLASADGKYLKLDAKVIAPDADIDQEMCYEFVSDISELSFPPIPETK